MDLVNFRTSLTSPPLAAVTPPGPTPGSFTVTQSSPFSLDSSSSSNQPHHSGGSPSTLGGRKSGGSPVLNVLMGMNSTLTSLEAARASSSSLAPPAPTTASQDEETYLLALVDEVTKDEVEAAETSFHSFHGPMGDSTTSIPGATGSHSMILSGVANAGQQHYSVSPTLRGQQVPTGGGPPGRGSVGGPPGYDEVAGGNASTQGFGNWSIGSPERAEAMMLGHAVGGQVPPGSQQQQQPLYTSSPEPNGGAPVFPSPSSAGEAPKYGTQVLTPQQRGLPGPAPPPPTGGAPPSFATAVASMQHPPSAQGGVTSPPPSGTAPPPPPPPPQQAGRMPETLIVRNEHGVFLLQPVGSTSPLAGPVPHGNALSPVPTTHGMAAPPPPALGGGGRGASSQGNQAGGGGMGGSTTAAPPAYGAPRKQSNAIVSPTPGAAAPPPPPPPPGQPNQGHHHHNGSSPIPSANSSLRGPMGGSQGGRGGLPGYGAAPAYGSESPQGSTTCPPPYALPPPGSAPLVSSVSPQAAPQAVGNGSMLGMDALPPPPPPLQQPQPQPQPQQAPTGGAVPPPPPPPYGGPKGGR